MEMLLVTEVTCPHCRQVQEVLVDRSAGDQEYVEDCQVCCSPMSLSVRLDPHLDLAAIDARREND